LQAMALENSSASAAADGSSMPAGRKTCTVTAMRPVEHDGLKGGMAWMPLVRRRSYTEGDESRSPAGGDMPFL